jgi:hypothetical protein
LNESNPALPTKTPTKPERKRKRDQKEREREARESKGDDERELRGEETHLHGTMQQATTWQVQAKELNSYCNM